MRQRSKAVKPGAASTSRRKAGVLGLGLGCCWLVETSPFSFVAPRQIRSLGQMPTASSRLSAPQQSMLPCSGMAAMAAVFLVPRTISRIVARRAGSEPGQTGTVTTEKPKEEEEEDEPFFEEVAGDDPMVLELEERLKKMNGDSSLTLDMLLSPGTGVNFEREIIMMRAELKATPEEEKDVRKELEDNIEAKQMRVVEEMKNVMTDSLKLEFIIQAVLGQLSFGFMVYGQWPWIPDLTWLNMNRLGSELLILLVGTWGPVILTVPALRARKPGGPYGMGYEEKRALDISFLILPFVNLAVPFFAQEPAIATYWVSTFLIGCLYAWSFNTPVEGNGKVTRSGVADVNLPEPVMWAIRSLDYSTGSERGAKQEDEFWQERLRGYEKAAEELEAKRLSTAEQGDAKAWTKSEKDEVKAS